jgi:hypothetical protein
MPTNSTSWFDVDKAGLSRLVLGRKRSALIYELVSNSLDENSTTVEVHLCRLSRGLARLDVHDDNPSGFADLSHGYTLFADSGKKNNPTQRGRFNLGEKLVLACCNNARITSTTGTIRFTPQGREFDPDHKTEIGTVFSAHIRMTVKEIAEAVQDLKRILVPSHQEVRINGNPLPRRTPTATFSATLKTETADPDTGILRRTSRKTKVWLYPVLGGEKPMLHEMGIPVVRLGGDRWHVDIAQKIPLTLDRTNVPPSFVQAVRTTIVNHMAEALTEEDVTQPWVTQAISDKKIEPAALTQVVDKRFGPDAVTYDPSDPEGSKSHLRGLPPQSGLDPGAGEGGESASPGGTGNPLIQGRVQQDRQEHQHPTFRMDRRDGAGSRLHQTGNEGTRYPRNCRDGEVRTNVLGLLRETPRRTTGRDFRRNRYLDVQRSSPRG